MHEKGRTLQYSTVQYSTLQYSTVQYSTVYSAIQFRVTLWCIPDSGSHHSACEGLGGARTHAPRAEHLGKRHAGLAFATGFLSISSVLTVNRSVIFLHLCLIDTVRLRNLV